MYEDVFSEINYCAVTTSNQFQDAFNRAANRNAELARAYIRNAGRDCLADTLQLTRDAVEAVGHVDTPIRGQLRKNLSAIEGVHREWQDLFDKVTRSGGDGAIPRWVIWAAIGFILFAINNC